MGRFGLFSAAMTEDAKKQRLAAALRENLRKRKAQAREGVPASEAAGTVTRVERG